MKDLQSCISLFVAYKTIASRGTSPDVTTVYIFHTWPYGRFIEIQSNFK